MIWIFSILFLVLTAGIIFVVLKITSQINSRLNSMSEMLLKAYNALGANLNSSTEVYGNVKQQLGRLEETNRQIIEISRDISSLQELLRAPKFRGAMGETLLENLLSQVLPQGNFSVQYRFSTGDLVDAVIRLGERLVPVDAKFSLENFQRMLDSTDDQTKTAASKKFLQDTKNRIDEVSSKYILPEENTYDFALMYIPAENVYYEVIIKSDVLSYSLSRKVIPVSPNTFYAYLQVICLGLKGLKVEENAKAILKNLSALGVEVSKFKDDFTTLGLHLANASTKYNDSSKRLERFHERISNIQNNKAIEGK
jgi:DNA recombination protein RmuC